MSGQAGIIAVVPTYRRQPSLDRLWRSLRTYAPDLHLAVIVQEIGTVPPPGTTVLHRQPGLIAPHYRAGAAAVRDRDPLGYLFLDDDHELRPAFTAALPGLISWLQAGIDLVTLPLRPGLGAYRPGSPVLKAGGLLVRAATYWRVGGHGDDYADDVELGLRVALGGGRIERWPEVVTRHHYRTPGGLDALPGSPPRVSRMRTLSRLPERYPGLVVPAPADPLGFRIDRAALARASARGGTTDATD